MKKTLLVAAFALAGSFAFAQKPSAGNKTAEVNLNFQTGTSAINYTLPAELRLRYFMSDNAAVRVRFGLGSTTDKTSITNGTTQSDRTEKSGFGLTLTPGYEMHFEGTDKLSPYVGAQLGIALGGKRNIEVTNASVANPNVGDIVKDSKFSQTDGSGLGITLGLMMGADYYIADGVYLGGEFGLGLFSMNSIGEGTTSRVVSGGTAVETKTLKSSSSQLFGVSTGGVRLGFVF
ncbi:MAG: hypothetical protein CFE21_09030 [Bacteroidetes bacterium B1(2017)]|nr:MAG: hypothetical protein CFE21_09030 [Bacteroidetes bacterium B1(2017)]